MAISVSHEYGASPDQVMKHAKTDTMQGSIIIVSHMCGSFNNDARWDGSVTRVSMERG